MAARSRLAQTVFIAIEEIIEQMGFELVDVVLVKEGPAKFLRVFIDKRGGITVDDCTDVSRAIDPIIDEQLKITEHDYLEVSSPGLDRPLRTTADFARYSGQQVEVSLYRALDGRKKYQGTLLPSTADLIEIELEEKKRISFNGKDVAKVRRIVVFT